MAHRHLTPYLKAWATGDANKTAKFACRKTFVVGTTRVARNLFGLFKRMLTLSERSRRLAEEKRNYPFPK